MPSLCIVCSDLFWFYKLPDSQHLKQRVLLQKQLVLSISLCLNGCIRKMHSNVLSIMCPRELGQNSAYRSRDLLQTESLISVYVHLLSIVLWNSLNYFYLYLQDLQLPQGNYRSTINVTNDQSPPASHGDVEMSHMLRNTGGEDEPKTQPAPMLPRIETTSEMLNLTLQQVSPPPKKKICV